MGEEDIAGIDLSTFVSQSLIVGAHAIGTAGGVQCRTPSTSSGSSPTWVRTAESTTKDAETTTAVVDRATEAMQKAASEATNAIAEAGKDARRSFAGNVDDARKSLLEAPCDV